MLGLYLSLYWMKGFNMGLTKEAQAVELLTSLIDTTKLSVKQGGIVLRAIDILTEIQSDKLCQIRALQETIKKAEDEMSQKRSIKLISEHVNIIALIFGAPDTKKKTKAYDD